MYIKGLRECSPRHTLHTSRATSQAIEAKRRSEFIPTYRERAGKQTQFHSIHPSTHPLIYSFTQICKTNPIHRLTMCPMHQRITQYPNKFVPNFTNFSLLFIRNAQKSTHFSHLFSTFPNFSPVFRPLLRVLCHPIQPKQPNLTRILTQPRFFYSIISLQKSQDPVLPEPGFGGGG